MPFDVAAALSVSVESKGVDTASASLDKFVGTSDRADRASGGLSRTMQRMIDLMQMMEKHLAASNAALKAIEAGMGGMSSATQAAATAQDKASAAMSRTTTAATKQAAATDRLSTGGQRAAAEAEKLATATQRAGIAMVQVSANADRMAAAAARIEEAEKLAAQAGIELSVTQMQAVGSGKLSADAMIKQALAAQNVGVEAAQAGDDLARFTKAANDTGAAAGNAAQKAADVAASVERVAASGNTAANAYLSVGSSIQTFALAQAAATREIDAAKAAHKAGQISLEEYKRRTLEARTALAVYQREHNATITALYKAKAAQDGLNDSSRTAALATRSLGYSFVELAQQAATGRLSLVDILQQAPRIADTFATLAKETGGAGNAIGQLAGRFAPAAIAIGTAAAAMGAWLLTINDENREKLDAYTKSLGLTEKQIEAAGGAAVTASDLMHALWDTIKEALELEQIFSDLKKWIIGTFRDIATDAKKNISEIYAAIYTIDDILKYVGEHGGQVFAEGVINGLNAVKRAINNFGTIYGDGNKPVWSPGLRETKNQYDGMGAAAAKSFAASYEKYRVQAERTLQSTIDRIGEGAVRHRNQRLADAVTASAKKAGKTAGDEFAKELLKALDKLAEDVDDTFLKIIMDGRKAMADRAKAEWASMVEDIEKAQAARVKPIEDAVKAQDAWNDQLRDTIDLLDRIGGMGKSLGDIGAMLYGFTSGDFSGIRGPLGGLAGSLFSATDENGNKVLSRLGRDFRDALDDVFGGSGSFTKTMNGFLQGAGIGGTVGGILGGSGTAQIGGMVGGAIGGALGDNLGKAIGGALGESIGEVAGPIVGSIIGSVVGDALAGTKKGRVDLGSTGITNTYGNSDQRIAAATSLGGSVYDSLNRIAEALGATASGNFSGAIGIRKNTIRYNPTSGSLRTGKGATIYATESEAIAAAISDAISDGVFTGLSDGVERLLKNGGDLETQLQKALSFQGVFDELKQMKDPQGAALDDLTKWHDNMLAIFNEAGATSDQLAQLEELTGLKRTEIAEKYGDAISNAEDIANQKRQLEIQIMQLQGKTVEALAAARQMEKAAADASLGALYDHIYALQDQASAAAAAAQAADRMASLQIRLAQAQGNDALATSLQLQQELAGAASDAERDLINQIYAAEAASKAAAAAEAQRQKEQAEAEEIERQRSQLMLELLRAQGKAEVALAMERQAHLLTLDQSLRALQQQVWAEQDLAQKREDAAKVVENARNAISQSYQKEAQAIQQTIDKFKGFSDTLRDLRDSLFSGTGFDDLASLQRKYNLAFTSALGGDVKGFEALPAALNAYRDAAITQAGSAAEARMITARLAQDLTRAIGSADDAADYQQLSLDALNQSVDSLIDIKEEVASVREAIADLKEALAEQTALQEQVGKTQIRAQQETNRLWRDVTDGGFGIKTQPVDA